MIYDSVNGVGWLSVCFRLYRYFNFHESIENSSRNERRLKITTTRVQCFSTLFLVGMFLKPLIKSFEAKYNVDLYKRRTSKTFQVFIVFFKVSKKIRFSLRRRYLLKYSTKSDCVNEGETFWLTINYVVHVFEMFQLLLRLLLRLCIAEPSSNGARKQSTMKAISRWISIFIEV